MKSDIRTELLAHQPTQRNIPIEALLRIQKVIDTMERRGRSEETIKGYEKQLGALANKEIKDLTGKHNLNLDNPAEVELAIARWTRTDPKTRIITNQKASNCYKGKLVDAYNHYRKYYKLEWSTGEKPIYKKEEHGIIPPTDDQCRTLMTSFKMPLSLKVDISTQTGLRPIEVTGEKGIRVKDFRSDQKAIISLSTKNCYARPPMNITNDLCAKIQEYINKKGLDAEDLLFTQTPTKYGQAFRKARKKLSEKLKNPELNKIRLYDLRHYYVTKQLRKTNNCEIVRQIVGHKRLNTTQRYIHLLANSNSGEWIVEGTSDKERAKQLLALDFSYQLTTPDGTMLFRKPK